MVYTSVKIITVFNSCIAPTHMFIPTVHISTAIETSFKGAEHDLYLVDIRVSLAVDLTS